MDEPGLDSGRHFHALRSLGRINRLSRSAAILGKPIRRLVAQWGLKRLRLLDVACGGGDITIDLWRQLRSLGIEATVDGVDISPRAAEFARCQARAAGAAVVFDVADILAGPPSQRYDVVAASLFLHHLTETQAVVALRHMAAAADRLVLINDLRRSSAGYALAWTGSRLLTRSDVVHVDGPRSVAGAFTEGEAVGLARQAGLADVAVRRQWPFRYLLSWARPEPCDTRPAALGRPSCQGGPE